MLDKYFKTCNITNIFPIIAKDLPISPPPNPIVCYQIKSKFISDRQEL